MLECPKIDIPDKLNRINGYMKTLFCSFVAMVVFLVLLGFLIKYVNSESYNDLYAGLLLALAFSYFAIWRKYTRIKILQCIKAKGVRQAA